MRFVVVTQRLTVWAVLPRAALAFLYLAWLTAVGDILLFALGGIFRTIGFRLVFAVCPNWLLRWHKKVDEN